MAKASCFTLASDTPYAFLQIGSERPLMWVEDHFDKLTQDPMGPALHPLHLRVFLIPASALSPTRLSIRPNYAGDR
jgi:hypothetical protein